MKIPTQEQLYVSLQRGMEATRDLAVAKPALMERREALIRQAINDYEASRPDGQRKLDGMGALLFVAALVENRRLIDDLEFAERKGRRAGEQLMKGEE